MIAHMTIHRRLLAALVEPGSHVSGSLVEGTPTPGRLGAGRSGDDSSSNSGRRELGSHAREAGEANEHA